MSPPPGLRIFAKGNVDVRDSLLWSRVNGQVGWNGLNQLFREQGRRQVARIRHETAIGFDFIPLPDRPAPAIAPELLAHLPAGESYPLAQQRQTALFEKPADLVVLSLQPDLMNQLALHRASASKFYPEYADRWGPAARDWFARECAPGGLSAVDDAMAALERLLDAIDERLRAAVLVYNICPIVPGERIPSYLGAGDALALRAKRLNLALAELSTQRDFSIVDLERLSASAGAARLKVDMLHFTDEGWRLIAEEVARIAGERGLLDGAAA